VKSDWFPGVKLSNSWFPAWTIGFMLAAGKQDSQYETESFILSSLRTDTQITFSLHFTPLGIRLSPCVAQPGAFLVLETIILGH